MDANPDFRAISGNIVFPGFTAPKVEWVRKNEPQVFDRTAKILLPKDYLNLWLTGDHVSEMSDAAGTSWLDTGARDWSDRLLGACRLTRSHMPRLVEGSAAAGRLRAELARRFGLGAAVVAGGAGDNAAAATGLGVVRPDDAFVSLGTSGVLFVSNASYSPNAASAVHAFCHAIPETWHQMGVILSATDALNWLATVIGRTPADLAGAITSARAPGGVTFLPYLSGERTPHNDAKVRGAFTGLAHATSTEDLTRAVMDGVAFALRDCLEALKVAGTRPRRLLATGGGARSRAWLQAIATLLDLPVDLPADGDFGAALGAARLGLLAAEGGDPGAVCTAPKTAETIEPIGELAAAYAAAWQNFRKLYPALREA
jgi:xylulokinase